MNQVNYGAVLPSSGIFMVFFYFVEEEDWKPYWKTDEMQTSKNSS